MFGFSTLDASRSENTGSVHGPRLPGPGEDDLTSLKRGDDGDLIFIYFYSFLIRVMLDNSRIRSDDHYLAGLSPRAYYDVLKIALGLHYFVDSSRNLTPRQLLN